MFRKIKAAIGFGSASVDTVIHQTSYTQGETLTGTVYIKGGDIEQNIDAITLQLCTEVKVEVDNSIHYQRFVLAQIAANEAFTIQANEEKQFDFSLPLFGEIPITALSTRKNQCTLWIDTDLDIDFGLDAKDRDYIEIKPLPCIQTILDLFEREDFTFTKADVEKGYLNGGHFKSTTGCYQELEFQKHGFFSKKEIELSFIVQGDNVHCLVEIDDTRGRGDSYISLSFDRFATNDEILAKFSPILL